MASPYLKAALLTLAVTLFGFFFISQLDSMRASELKSSIEDLAFQSDSERLLLLYSQVMGSNKSELCDYVSITTDSRASRAYTLAEKIRTYEQSNVLNAEYDRIRKQYYLANMELYLNIVTREKYCGSSPYTTVVFFYRINPDCPECRAQGGVLDGLRGSRPNLRVFAFPIDGDQEFIRILARRHNVTSAPTLVVGDSAVLEGLKSEEELDAALPGKAG